MQLEYLPRKTYLHFCKNLYFCWPMLFY